MKRYRFYLKKNSIIKKLFIPMMIVMLIQAALFTGGLLLGGTIEQLEHNSFDILNERVINRKSYIQNEMIQHWSNLGSAMVDVNAKVTSVLSEFDADTGDIQTNTGLARKILDNTSQNILNIIRQNSVTGAFLILNGQEPEGLPIEEDITRSGIYIRDADPETAPEDNSDLLIERAPSSITKKLNIPMNSQWSSSFTFYKDAPKGDYDFYYKPFDAAIKHPEIGYADLGYWSRSFRLNSNDIPIITYTVPLVSEDGIPYGVLGVEISTDYLRKQLPYSEIISEKQGTYLLAVDGNYSMNFDNIIASGPLYKQLLGEQVSTEIDTEEIYNNSYYLTQGGRLKEKAYGCVQYFKLYNSNTPFEDERWALIGIVKEDDLLSFSKNVRISVLTTLLLSLVIGFIAVIIVGTIVAQPIIALVNKLRDSDPQKSVKLDKIKIKEIDELSSAIENLSRNVADNASKLSQIIDMANISIGAFEYKDNAKEVYCTRKLFSVFGLEELDNEWQDIASFQKYLNQIEKYLDSKSEDNLLRIYKLEDKEGIRWVRLKIVHDDLRTLGVAVNITSEVLEKQKIEYERDYDSLTNLLNRRAFHRILEKKFSNPPKLKISALIMLDLDNLKFINDTYGHDYGDQYIRCAADILKKFIPNQAVVSRMSGDEFNVFFYGYETKDEIRKIVETMKNSMRNSYLVLPNTGQFKIRASAGVAWYPDDANTIDLLLRYADFAMYKIKNTVKGEFIEFDIASYNKDAYLLHNKEELNKLIDEQLVDYYFQPIVDAITGEVYAYEALMRSKLDSLRSPLEILTLAKSQSKLYQIEHLTWFKALETYQKHKSIFSGIKIFINSISNQILSIDDFQMLENQYGENLNGIVMELTEEEKCSDEYTHQKKEFLKKWNGKLALDDFGAGYNGDTALLSLSPDYVKIDMSIVRDIDSDENRLKMFVNLVSYSHERNIKVIAEGVETERELQTLIENGADYLQGYYLGVPQAIPSAISQDKKEKISEYAHFAGR